MPKTLELFQKMKYNDSEKWRYVKLDYQRQNALIKNPELALPNALSATADNRKFTEYLFGGTHENGLVKGAAFTSRLGYDISNYDKLKDEILKKLKLMGAKNILFCPHTTDEVRFCCSQRLQRFFVYL